MNNFLNTNNFQAQDPYQELMKLRCTSPYNQYRTVFNDIADEWTNCPEEERNYIEQDSDYAAANLTYAQQFNAFLIDQFGLQFANSKYAASAEQVLIALRNARKKYRNSAVEDVVKIKKENADLQKQIKELEELINDKR